MGHDHKYSKSRRKFIQQTGCAAMGYGTFLSSVINLKAMSAAAISDSTTAAMNDYKAIVCLSLDGGIDSFNTLMPHTQEEHNRYAQARSGVYNPSSNPRGIAIPRNNLRVLNSLNTPGRTFGLHPSMVNIQNLFNQGKVAFLANVGTLVEPITRQEFWSDSKRTPLALLSHADQLQQWMTGLPNVRSGIGWGGRVADMINDMYNPSGSAISMNISLNGANIFQTGNQTIEYSVSSGRVGQGGAKTIRDFQPEWDWEYTRIRREAINSLLETNYADIYERTYMNTLRTAKNAYDVFNAAVNNINLNTPFPDYSDYNAMSLANGLYKAAQSIIASKNDLNFHRQTYFINYGGWDHHDEVRDAMTQQLSVVDNSLAAFQQALENNGIADDVLTIVISDFSRTLGSNGNGTDHGWGGNVFVMGTPASAGGPLHGQRIYGNFPTSLLFNDNGIDVGGGVLIPALSTDVYFAEVARWFGVSSSNVEDLFPNLRNFYRHEVDGPRPMGMLNY